MVAWNKAYRREFVERAGLRFPPGYYEDTPWTYPALMARAAHRDPRPGLRALPPAPPGQHPVHHQPQALRRLRAVRPGLRVRRQRPELAGWRPVLFRRMVDHLSTVFTKPATACRAARAPSSCARPAPTTAVTAPRAPRSRCARRLRHTLVRCGVHRTYRALEASMPLRRRTPQGGRRNSPAPCGRPCCRRTTASSCGCRCAPTAPCSPRTGAADTAATRARWRPRSAPSRRRCARRGSPAPSTRTPSRRAAPGASGHGRLLDGAGPLQVPRQQRQLRPTAGQAPRADPRPDPARHPAQAHGPRPPGAPGGRPRHGLRRAAARASTSGTTSCPPTATPP